MVQRLKPAVGNLRDYRGEHRRRRQCVPGVEARNFIETRRWGHASVIQRIRLRQGDPCRMPCAADDGSVQPRNERGEDADSASFVGANVVPIISASLSLRQLSLAAIVAPSLLCNSSVGSCSAPETGKAGPIARTSVVVGSTPRIITPPIMTLSSVCTRPRVEMFASFESTVESRSLNFDQADAGGVTDPADHRRISCGIQCHDNGGFHVIRRRQRAIDNCLLIRAILPVVVGRERQAR